MTAHFWAHANRIKCPAKMLWNTVFCLTVAHNHYSGIFALFIHCTFNGTNAKNGTFWLWMWAGPTLRRFQWVSRSEIYLPNAFCIECWQYAHTTHILSTQSKQNVILYHSEWDEQIQIGKSFKKCKLCTFHCWR